MTGKLGVGEDSMTIVPSHPLYHFLCLANVPSHEKSEHRLGDVRSLPLVRLGRVWRFLCLLALSTLW